MTAAKSRRIAKAGESFTVKYLEEQGYTVLERNWRCGKQAELDIIAKDRQELIIFVEVKTRTGTTDEGFPQEGFETINRKKQQKMLRAARSYLLQQGGEGSARFDAALITVPEHFQEDMQPLEFVYVKEAFYP